MAELIQITQALEKVHSFNLIQRVLLTCAGTLQGTLSAIFNMEVTVRVTSQENLGGGQFARAVELVAGDKVACFAQSKLTLSNTDVQQKVMAQEMGIGQILETLGLRPSFELLEVGIHTDRFWRKYKLEAPGVTYEIAEEFPQGLYQQ